MKDILKKVWHYGRWVLLALVIAYIALVIYRTGVMIEQDKSAETVAAIHAQKITRDFVLNTHRNLPEPPDPTLDDSTVEGIDANNNGIRDDAELTIFLWHRDSARIRAAELQYAQALQAELTMVFNSETWKAGAQEESRAFYCMRVDAKLPTSETDRIEKLVLDTDLRRQKYDEVNNYITSYADLNVPNCDIDFKSLPN